MAERWGWHAPFWAALVAASVGFVLTLPLREGTPTSIGLKGSDLLNVGRERGLLIVSSLAILYQFNSFVTIFGFVPNYAVQLGASKAQLGWLSLIAAVPTAIASLSAGHSLARRFSERQLVTAGFVLTALSTFAIPLSKTVPVLYVTQAFGGVGRGLIFPVLMGLSIKTVSEEKRATAMGFFQSIYALGMFAGPALSGVLAGIVGLGGTFLITGILTSIGALAAAYAMSPRVLRYDKVKEAA